MVKAYVSALPDRLLNQRFGITAALAELKVKHEAEMAAFIATKPGVSRGEWTYHDPGEYVELTRESVSRA